MEQDHEAGDRAQVATPVGAPMITRGAEVEPGAVAGPGPTAIVTGRGTDVGRIGALAMDGVVASAMILSAGPIGYKSPSRLRNRLHWMMRWSSVLPPKHVAIPLFDGEVAPRFCFARWIMLAELMDREVHHRELLDVGECGGRQRLLKLAQRSVTLLVCSGFNRRFLRLAEGLGIFVSWGHVGPVEPLIELLCAGALPGPTVGSGRSQTTLGVPGQCERVTGRGMK